MWLKKFGIGTIDERDHVVLIGQSVGRHTRAHFTSTIHPFALMSLAAGADAKLPVRRAGTNHLEQTQEPRRVSQFGLETGRESNQPTVDLTLTLASSRPRLKSTMCFCIHISAAAPSPRMRESKMAL